MLSLGFLQDLSSLVQRPFSSDGQRAAAAALDLGHSQQAELEEDLCRGSKIRKKKKTLPNRTNPQIYNPNNNYRDVQLLSKKKKKITASQRQSIQSGILPITLTQLFVC